MFGYNNNISLLISKLEVIQLKSVRAKPIKSPGWDVGRKVGLVLNNPRQQRLIHSPPMLKIFSNPETHNNNTSSGQRINQFSH